MKNSEIIRRLAENLPDFGWISEELDETSIEASVACAVFTAGDNYSNSGECELDFSVYVKRKVVSYLQERNLLLDVEAFEEKLGLDKNNRYLDEPIRFSTIDENFLDLLIKGLKIWKEEIDKLRKSDTDEYQLIIIHPDWDLKGFEKDFKFLTPDHDYFDSRMGIMSTKDWDFGNEDLRDELQENSGDCFCIWPADDILDNSDNDNELKDAKDELRKLYPDLDKITLVYNTDFD